MSTVKLTPMMEQYLRVKEEHPDTLVFFRMGDFFELFFEDAQIAARELQIALTSRNPGAENPVPMCGMPHHAIDEYLRQLLDKGYKVALCDQVEDPKQAKGLVKREVTRVLTPGTVVEDINLDAKGHNFLGALFWDGDLGGGLAWVDFSTGAWSGIQTKNEAVLWQWLVKMNPRELLLAESQPLPKGLEHWQSRLSRYPQKSYFDGRGAEDKILRAQGVPGLQTLDLDDKPALTRCCGALLTYLELTQKRDLTHLAPFKPWTSPPPCSWTRSRSAIWSFSGPWTAARAGARCGTCWTRPRRPWAAGCWRPACTSPSRIWAASCRCRSWWPICTTTTRHGRICAGPWTTSTIWSACARASS